MRVTDLPFEDTTAATNADRGFIAALPDPVVKDESGKVVFDTAAYAFMDAECPDTANPSLWRQGVCVRAAACTR